MNRKEPELTLSDMTSSLHPEWDAAREFRAILLRFVAFAILLANLLLGGSEGAEGTHLFVVVSYFLISVASVVTVRLLPGRSWLKTLFGILDALLITLILYAHILAGPVTENHNLTTTSLVVAFLLLVHIGLKLDRLLVLVFSGIVLAGSRPHAQGGPEGGSTASQSLSILLAVYCLGTTGTG